MSSLDECRHSLLVLFFSYNLLIPIFNLHLCEGNADITFMRFDLTQVIYTALNWCGIVSDIALVLFCHNTMGITLPGIKIERLEGAHNFRLKYSFITFSRKLRSP